jgi:hypothetical protein
VTAGAVDEETMDQHEPVVNTTDITPKWVESCLRSHFNLPSGAVGNVRVTESFSSCSALNTRIEVEYSTDAVGNAPRHLMLRNSGGRDRLNEREVPFYSEPAPLLPQTPTVPCYDVAWDLSPPRWHVLLLDVSPSHDHGPQPLTTTQRQFLMPAHARDTSAPGALSGPDLRSNCPSIRKPACTLVQSDSHLGNILLDRDPASSHIYLLDWDAYQRGIGPWDLACLLILSHAPEIRRRVELRILKIYHRALLAHGVANYSFDQCVADYRLAAFVCPFVPIVWGRPEFVTYALTAFDDWNCADLVR